MVAFVVFRSLNDSDVAQSHKPPNSVKIASEPGRDESPEVEVNLNSSNPVADSYESRAVKPESVPEFKSDAGAISGQFDSAEEPPSSTLQSNMHEKPIMRADQVLFYGTFGRSPKARSKGSALASEKGAFSIEIGRYPSAKLAQEELERLRKNGLTTFIQKENTGQKKPRFALRHGIFTSRRKALDASNRINREHSLSSKPVSVPL